MTISKTTVTQTISGGTLTITEKENIDNEKQNSDAFAAIKADGSVVTWGRSDYGGDSRAVANSLNGSVDVQQIYSTGRAFAALRADGSVVTWGSQDEGGNSSAVKAQLNGSVDVQQIFSNYGAFAALRTDGSVVTWGYSNRGGDSSAVAVQLDGRVDVKQIYSTTGAFAALRTDGSVVTWGELDWGGDSSEVAAQLDGRVDVKQIYSTTGAFAALRTDGSVFTWGELNNGGDSSAVANSLNGSIDVQQIFSNSYAFAALRTDGSVVTWGDSISGGDTSTLMSSLNGIIDVQQIYSAWYAFAALRADGSVVTWGQSKYGGDSRAVANSLNGNVDVQQIYSTGTPFAALRTDGSVVTWGNSSYGGDSSAVANLLNGSVDVQQIYSTGGAFAAIRVDGSVVTWGRSDSGGDSSAVANLLNGSVDVQQIYSTDKAFSALRTDGSVVTWGNIYDSNDNLVPVDTSTVAEQLKSAVVSLANAKTDDVYIARPMNYPPTGTLSITGLSTQGQILTASNSIADLDGLGIVSYQWLRDDIPIAGANSKTYALTQSDVGKNTRVSASYIDGLGKLESVTSNTVKIANVKDAPTGSVSIIGKPSRGELLTMAINLDDADGMGLFIHGQWLRDGIAIVGATKKTYTLTAEDVGKSISSKVNYTDLLGTTESVSSNTIKIVHVNTVPTGSISISGSLIQGQVLTVSNSLADLDGLGIISYQRMNNGKVIKNANQETYTLTSADAGKTISLKASYTDLQGTSESVSSESTTVVISTKPTKSDDLLTGTVKNNTLSALAGNDTLNGGSGADKLTGGKGADIFTFTSVDDSGVTAKTRNTITDFKPSEGDKIDLSGLGFSDFIGTQAFSTTNATGQVRFDAQTRILYGSTNADSQPEFSILLSGIKILVADDLIITE